MTVQRVHDIGELLGLFVGGPVLLLIASRPHLRPSERNWLRLIALGTIAFDGYLFYARHRTP